MVFFDGQNMDSEMSVHDRPYEWVSGLQESVQRRDKEPDSRDEGQYITSLSPESSSQQLKRNNSGHDGSALQKGTPRGVAERGDLKSSDFKRKDKLLIEKAGTNSQKSSKHANGTSSSSSGRSKKAMKSLEPKSVDANGLSSMHSESGGKKKGSRRDTWNSRVVQSDFANAGLHSSHEPRSNLISELDSRYSRYNDPENLDERLEGMNENIRSTCQMEAEISENEGSDQTDSDNDNEDGSKSKKISKDAKKPKTLKELTFAPGSRGGNKSKSSSKNSKVQKKEVHITTFGDHYKNKSLKHKQFVNFDKMNVTDIPNPNVQAAIANGNSQTKTKSSTAKSKTLGELYKKILFVVVMPDEARMVREKFDLLPDNSLEDDPFVEAYMGEIRVPLKEHKNLFDSNGQLIGGGDINSIFQPNYTPGSALIGNAGHSKNIGGFPSMQSGFGGRQNFGQPRSNLSSAMGGRIEGSMLSTLTINEDQEEDFNEENSTYFSNAKAGNLTQSDFVTKQVFLVVPKTESHPDGVVSISSEPSAVATCIGIRRYNPDLVVSAGTCGGIQNKSRTLKHGDVIVPKRCYYLGKQYVGASNTPKFAAFLSPEYPLLDPSVIVDKVLKRNCAKPGILGTAHSFISSDSPARNAGVDVVDMECAGEARVCYQLEKPFTALKVVSDVEVGPPLTSYSQFFKVVNVDANNLPIDAEQAAAQGINVNSIMVNPQTNIPLNRKELEQIKRFRKQEQLVAMKARQSAWESFIPLGPSKVAQVCFELVWGLDDGIKEYYLEKSERKLAKENSNNTNMIQVTNSNGLSGHASDSNKLTNTMSNDNNEMKHSVTTQSNASTEAKTEDSNGSHVAAAARGGA